MERTSVLSGDRLLDLWRLRIAGCQESGLSQKAYCLREGFGLSTFQRWYRRLRLENPHPSSLSSVRLSDHFMPVSVLGESLPRLEVHLGNGHHLCFQGTWDWNQILSSLQPFLR